MSAKKLGYFGTFGGRYVAQPLMVELEKLEHYFETYKNDATFLEELHKFHATYCGRPTMITPCTRLSKLLGGAHIYLKREDMTNIGAHKINHSIYQGLLAKRIGKKELIAETGAGMHGTAVATVGAVLGLPVKVFMGSTDIKRQAMNVERIKMLGAEVIAVEEGSATLKDAVNAAMKYRVNNLESSYYLLGSALGPHPYPTIVREAQSVIGVEVRNQFKGVSGSETPDTIIACVGGGSNALGIFSEFVPDEQIHLIGVEAGGSDTHTVGKHAARIGGKGGKFGVFQGYASYFLQDNHGNMEETASISAGLDYAGIGPEHAYLHSIGRVQYVSASDQEVLDAVDLLAQNEGILSALESAHAVAHAIKIAPTLPSTHNILVNLSGRGDKDLHTILAHKKKKQFT